MPDMTPSPKQVPESRSPRGLVIALLLLVIPALTIGPAFVPGARLLPQLPVASAPLATENPSAAAAALEGMNWSTSDRLFPVLTDQLEANRQVAEGNLPTWDPNLGAGVPLFGASIAGLAYPPNWLAFVLPPDLAAAPLAMLSLFLAGLGLLLFLRMRELSFEAAMFGAMAMQTGLWGLANLHDFMKVDAALWTPWMLYGIECLRAGRRRGGFVLALAVGLSLLAGFPPIAIFGLVTAGLVALVRLVRQPRVLAAALGFVILGLGIGAWQLLPALEASNLSIRQSRDASTMQAEALPLSTTAALLIPDLFGAPDAPVFDSLDPAAAWLTSEAQEDKIPQANALEWNLHFGTLALLLALVALVARPRAALLPAGLFVLWLGFAQGWPGLHWLYWVPGLDLGAPGRALAMGWPLLAWLAALGVDALAAEFAALSKLRDPLFPSPPRPGRLATTTAGLVGFLFATGGLTGWALLDPRQAPEQLFDLLAARHGLGLAEVESMLRATDVVAAAERLRAALGGLFASGLFLLTVVCFARLAAGRLLPGRGTLAMALALAVALAPRLAAGALEIAAPTAALLALGAGLLLLILTHGPGSDPERLTQEAWRTASWRHSSFALMLFLGLAVEALDVAPSHLQPRFPVGSIWPTSPALDALAQGAPTASEPAGPAARAGRVLRVDTSPSGVSDVVELARPNLLSAYGIRDLTPYMVFTPRTLVELVTAVDPTARFRSGIAALHDPALLDSPVLDLLRVDTILSKQPLSGHTERLTALDTGDAGPLSVPGFFAYHRRGALPEALLVGRAQLLSDEEAGLAALAAADFDPRGVVYLAPGSELPPGANLTPGTDPNREIQIEHPSASRLDAKVTSTTGGWLLFTEQFVPDWKVNIDGEDAVMLRADHALRALWIPPGEHLVRTWYEPWSLRYGCASMVLACLLLMLLAWRTRRAPWEPRGVQLWSDDDSPSA